MLIKPQLPSKFNLIPAAANIKEPIRVLRCYFSCFAGRNGADSKLGGLVCSVVIPALNGGDQSSDFRIRLWSACGSVALIALKRGNYSPGNTSTQTWICCLSVWGCECVFLHPGSFSQTFQQRDRVSTTKAPSPPSHSLCGSGQDFFFPPTSSSLDREKKIVTHRVVSTLFVYICFKECVCLYINLMLV